MIHWWDWPTFIIIFFYVSCFSSLESLLNLVQNTATPHPPGRTTLVIISILFFSLSILVKSLLNSTGYCDQDPLIPVFDIHNFSECITGILSLVTGDDIIRGSILLDIFSSSIHMLPRCYLLWCPQGYLQYKYTGYQYPFLPPCPAENYDEYKYVLYEYLLTFSSLENCALIILINNRRIFHFVHFFQQNNFNFTFCEHAENATYPASVLLSVTFLWVFDKLVSSVPPSVATKPLTLFPVSLSVA